MRLLKVSSLCLLLLGCNESARKEFFPTPTENAQRILYVKDQRTGLCFVFNSVGASAQGGGGDVYTNVPCSPEVERLINETKPKK
jgi:hypothetical protein